MAAKVEDAGSARR
jgi:hypothetical protein